MSKTSAFWIYMAVSLLAMLFPELAMAAGPFAVDDTDMSKRLVLDELFGPITGASSSSPMSEVVTVFNQAMLFVGGVLLAYTLVAGTMSTAHDGEMLGKKWSAMWVPIRTAMGVAALIPIPSMGGFCFIQVCVVWLALQGVGIANKAWEAYVGDGSSMIDASIFYTPPGTNRQIKDLVGRMLVYNTCVASNNYAVQSTTNPDNLDMQMLVAVKSDDKWLYGPLAICGTVNLMKPPADNRTKDEINSAAVRELFDTNRFERQMYPIHAQQVDAAQARLAPLAERLVSGDLAADHELAQQTVKAELDGITDAWSTALRTQAMSVYQGAVSPQFAENLKKDGWMLAGAWYMQIAKAQDAVTRGVSAAPSSTGATMSSISGGLVGFLANVDTNDMDRVEKFVKTATASSNMAVTAYGEADENSVMTKFVGWFINEDATLMDETSLGQINTNPVIMARNLGQNMTATGWAGYALAVVGLGASSAEGLTFSAGAGFATAVAPMLAMVAGTIIVSGATLSTYVPMLPYILWIGVVFGWIVLLVEAAIAAPMWAVAHLAPDGDGVVGRGGQGYMLVLSLTLRPVLMIIGFVAAIILMKPLGFIINSTFIGAFAANVSPSFWGLTQMIMGCVLYVVLMVSVINRVFALIHVVPDRLLRWIGGGGANELGQEAHGIEGNTAAKVVAGASASKMIGDSAQDAASRNLQRKQNEAHQKDTKAGTAAQQAGNDADAASRASTDFDRDYSMARAAEYSGDSSDQHANNARQSAGSAASASLNSAMSSARAAKAQASTRNATPEQKADAAHADAFLAAAGSVDRNDPAAVSNFIRGADTSRMPARSAMALNQGKTVLGRLDAMSTDLASIRAGRQQPTQDPPVSGDTDNDRPS